LLEANFRAYVNGFSRNIDDIIEHFNYRATITLMVKNNRLAPILSLTRKRSPPPTSPRSRRSMTATSPFACA
jgi:type I restriction enzyme M protein